MSRRGGRRASAAPSSASSRREGPSREVEDDVAQDAALVAAQDPQNAEVPGTVGEAAQGASVAESTGSTEARSQPDLASDGSGPLATTTSFSVIAPTDAPAVGADTSQESLAKDVDPSANPEAALSPAAAPSALVTEPTPTQPETDKPEVDDLPGAEDKRHHDSLYLAMELEYDETWQDIADMSSLGPFRSEYEKMHRAVLKSRSNIEKMYGQYETSYREYCVNLVQTQEAKESSIQDQHMIKSLRTQITKAEETVEASMKLEESFKEELRQLKIEVGNLNATMQQGVGLSATQEKTLQELIQAKEQSTKELEEELEKIVHLRNSIADVSERIKMADQQKRELEREIYELRDRSASKKAEIDAELRIKEKLERDLRELRVVVGVKLQEVRGKQDAVNRATDDITIIESQIRTQRQMTEKLVKDEEALNIRMDALQIEANEQMELTSDLMEQNVLMASELRRREGQLEKNLSEVRKVAKIKDALVKKLQACEEQKLEAELERKDIRLECEGKLDTIEATKRQIDVHKKAMDDLTRERDLIENNFHKAQSELNAHERMILLCKQTRHNIELDIARYNRECTDQTKTIKMLQAERDGYIAESIKLQTACVAGFQEIKSKEVELFDYKKRTSQADTKLKHQQNLYEAVQSDRNLHSKHLIEAQAEIAKMKRRLKIMNFQINGFKEDINSKQQALTAEAAEHAKLQKDIEIISEEIATLQHQNDLGQAYIRSQSAEANKLNQFVKEAEMERSRQENALKILVTERDNLSNQLIKQNGELEKAYDALKLRQASLLCSERHFAAHIEKISELRREISRLRREKAGLDLESSAHLNTQETARHLETDLLTQQMRIKALEDQLKHRINVHRWRKLEGKNPKVFDMILLLQSLQKKLIMKSQEENDKEKLIHSKEMLYLYLKTLLAKQVGPEALEQISEYQQILKDKNMQFRHMGTELNMYQAQLREYRYEISQFDKTMQVLKSQYLVEHRDRGMNNSPVGKKKIRAAVGSGKFPNGPPPPLLPSMDRADANRTPPLRSRASEVDVAPESQTSGPEPMIAEPAERSLAPTDDVAYGQAPLGDDLAPQDEPAPPHDDPIAEQAEQDLPLFASEDDGPSSAASPEAHDYENDGEARNADTQASSSPVVEDDDIDAPIQQLS
ncbi:uncharacterized protein EV422DRAFT_17575 [Fimicolochytrium jonesii]|uniref:uncharacterized protein n=1 Tax=Fimicolochytrium jonesii TaxID=1396493 RepID=UPI0022FECE46|nr:uncharacterized protein EV422DRAFT_17575 [Fimicolochytrium jonesii]KAI8826923.1 hypothetical protein EV422DRAFT_17575 [Fimicolochytrium jonesii]